MTGRFFIVLDRVALARQPLIFHTPTALHDSRFTIRDSYRGKSQLAGYIGALTMLTMLWAAPLCASSSPTRITNREWSSTPTKHGSVINIGNCLHHNAQSDHSLESTCSLLLLIHSHLSNMDRLDQPLSSSTAGSRTSGASSRYSPYNVGPSLHVHHWRSATQLA